MFNQQKARWMMLGWLGRAHSLISIAIGCNYLSADKKSTHAFFTLQQRDRLRVAVDQIYRVLEEVRGTKK